MLITQTVSYQFVHTDRIIRSQEISCNPNVDFSCSISSNTKTVTEIIYQPILYTYKETHPYPNVWGGITSKYEQQLSRYAGGVQIQAINLPRHF